MGNTCTKGSRQGDTNTKMVVKVKTGDKKGAGTNANIKIALVNHEGSVSKEFPLNVFWRNDFNAGSLDDFKIKNVEGFEQIKAVKISRDAMGLMDDWYLEWLSVRNAGNGQVYLFPVNRWIVAKKVINITEYDTLLPQLDPNFDYRREELNLKKQQYQTKVRINGFVPQLRHLPSDEKFSNEYLWDIASLKIKLTFHMGAKDLSTGKWESYDEIFSVYNDILPKPLGSETWKSDHAFGQQRLSHCNPTQIRRCVNSDVPEKMEVMGDVLLPFLEGLTVAEAIEAKRLYYVDYEIMKNLPCKDDRIVPAPSALFFVNKDKKFLPVAIRLFQDEENNPVFLPSDDSYTWLLAKLWFNNADANFHQSCTHLGFTHLIMEPFTLATHRSLSPSHPVFRLLAPHFLYLLAINSIGIKVLLSPDGWVDSALTVGAVGMKELMVRQLGNWRLDVQGNLLKDLEHRGVEDQDSLPNYYYRDDALPIYKAINKYVSEIIHHFYSSSDLIVGDYELQEWAKTLSSPVSDGGFGIPGVPGGGAFKQVDQIIDTVTSVIFTCSVAHAACNFSQYDDYAFPPNYPSYLEGPPPADKKPRTEDDIRQVLPSKKTTLDILQFTKILSSNDSKPLGDFEVKYLYDPVSEDALQKFRAKLKEISSSITRKNQFRVEAYTYLNPDGIPNSISI